MWDKDKPVLSVILAYFLPTCFNKTVPTALVSLSEVAKPFRLLSAALTFINLLFATLFVILLKNAAFLALTNWPNGPGNELANSSVRALPAEIVSVIVPTIGLVNDVIPCVTLLTIPAAVPTTSLAAVLTVSIAPFTVFFTVPTVSDTTDFTLFTVSVILDFTPLTTDVAFLTLADISLVTDLTASVIDATLPVVAFIFSPTLLNGPSLGNSSFF